MERASEDELTLTVAGQWTDYHVSLNWRGDLETLHIACAFDAKIPENRLNEVYRLVAQINEQLWLGHFDVWIHEGLIMYRHGLMLNGAVATTGSAKRCSSPRSRPASATTRPSSSSSGPARRAARRWPRRCSRPRGGPEQSRLATPRRPG